MKPERMAISLGCMSDVDTVSRVDVQVHSTPNLEVVEDWASAVDLRPGLCLRIRMIAGGLGLRGQDGYLKM